MMKDYFAKEDLKDFFQVKKILTLQDVQDIEEIIGEHGDLEEEQLTAYMQRSWL